jgi:uncharacterized membrane protein
MVLAGLKDMPMNRYVTFGLAVVAGAAIFEAALIPGVVIGGAAVLAPKVLPGLLPRLRRRARPAQHGPVHGTVHGRVRRQGVTAAPRREHAEAAQRKTILAVLPKLAVGEAIAKTITYRIIVTGLDFTVNYVVIGELATAAGLSTFNTVAAPLFYLGHEALWNYFGPAEGEVDLATLTRQRANGEMQPDGWRSFKISRTLAKTITFRTLATIMDFTTNYVVVRDVTQAVILSSSGFILGPFVYYGHEWAWDRFNTRAPSTPELPASPKLLPAPPARL